MMQYDHEGKSLFVHYNLLKQTQHTIHENYTFGRTKRSFSPCPLFASICSLAAHHLIIDAEFTMFLVPKGQRDVSVAPFVRRMHENAQDAEDPDFEDLFDKERGYGDGQLSPLIFFQKRTRT